MTDLPLGSSIAGLRIEAIAGRGGMGVVYRALDAELNRQVAVKVIAVDLAADPEFRQRFRRESRTAASVNHPNVIPVFQAGEERGLLYLAMQYADGTDLRELIRLHGRLDVVLTVSLVGQIAAALDAAHRRDLVHRDVKPANILVTTENGAPHVYLTDFGLTRSIRTTEQITRTGLVVGTAEYMAPELFEEYPASVASDVYALGCLLYQMLSGELPFKRTDSMALIAAHMTATPPSLGDAVSDPNLRAALDAVVYRAMAKRPGDRFTSAGELGAAVASAVQQARPAVQEPLPPAYAPPPSDQPSDVGPRYVVPADAAPARHAPQAATPPRFDGANLGPVNTLNLPRLTRLSPLGRGSAADVFLAWHVDLEKWVAAKVFRATLTDKAAVEQFRAECQTLVGLPRDRHLIEVHDGDVLPNGRPYLVTEHCDSSLHQLTAGRGPMPAGQVVDIGIALSTALQVAHDAGVVHGTVTPQNVLLRGSEPVLADFTLAVLRDYQDNANGSSALAHAAPETVRYDGAVERPTDVYGLGSTLYSALTGSAPFPARPGEGEAAHAHRIMYEQAPQPSGAPPWLADLMLAMLTKEPARRPTMTAVTAALTARAAGAATPPSPSYAAPPGAPTYLPPPDASWAPAAAPQGQPRRTMATAATVVPRTGTPAPDVRPGTTARGPRRMWLLTAGAVVLAILGGAAYLLSSRSEPSPTAGAATAKAHIQLAAPIDRGDTIDLSWSADATLDFGVLVGEQGKPQADAMLVGRVTHFSVPVQKGRPYCFRVQGVNPAGTVSESNVESVRDAVCRFSDP
ncbi:serine/threonine-protein kinase [Pseudonocardia sp. GCM10023141]|uniref:serine/threonine-protein kinase n=1 Tax=Pseudonocardia sp. GCM10023141 TaxID=3252653 RepID=UPI00361E7F8F